MADGLVAVDANRRILAFNRQAQRLTGRTDRKAQGAPIDRILAVRNAKGEPLRLPIHDLGAGSTTGVFIDRGDDDQVPVAITSAVLRDDSNEVAGAVAVIRDMTREREIERMKSEFLSNISHELRTPLTPIKGYAEILTRKEVPPDKAKRFTQGIVDSTARLERIVELLVDFASMEAGRLAPKSSPVDIADIVRKLGEATEARASRHDVVLDIRSRLPKVVGDERLLKRSLEEVLDNAVKFSPNGGTITLEVKGVASGNGQGKRRGVAVSISDQGIGIEPEDLQRIFSDFQQLDGSETRAYGGLGLGLAFVQRIVEAHDGRVDVTSAPDEGTRFTITLPGASAGARK
jgi:PAS domain S-box-containing protein